MFLLKALRRGTNVGNVRTSSRPVSAMAARDGIETAVLALGPDARYRKLPGIVEVEVGYTGGTTKNPTYNSVCKGDGHTEAILLRYDPTQVSYSKILEIFFDEHSPCRARKAQYKSAVYFLTPEQELAAKAAIEAEEKRSGQKVYTELLPASEWWRAEEYHQDYYNKCRM